MGNRIVGFITKPKLLTARIDKGTGMGELPSASGQSEFPMPAYSVNGTDLTAVGEAIAEKAGVEKPVFPDGWIGAVDGISPPDPVYNSPRGYLYTKNTVIHIAIDSSLTQSLYDGSEYMETVEFSGVDTVLAKNTRNIFQNCINLNEARMTTWINGCAALTFVNTPLLKKVTFGEVGRPVTALQGMWMRDCDASDVEVTVYVDAAALADIPTTVTSYANGGRSDSVIIYRNSTTGEVITE